MRVTYIELRNGPAVSPEALVLGVGLEARGCVLSVSADGRLQCSNGSQLTAEDRAAIVRNKHALIALVGYRAD